MAGYATINKHEYETGPVDCFGKAVTRDICKFNFFLPFFGPSDDATASMVPIFLVWKGKFLCPSKASASNRGDNDVGCNQHSTVMHATVFLGTKDSKHQLPSVRVAPCVVPAKLQTGFSCKTPAPSLRSANLR